MDLTENVHNTPYSRDNNNNYIMTVCKCVQLSNRSVVIVYFELTMHIILNVNQTYPAVHLEAFSQSY